MKNNLAQLTPQKHGKIKIKNGIDIAFFKNQNIVPVVLSELSKVAIETPIIFIKSTETGQFQLVTMLGLALEENLMIKDNQWQGLYIPQVMTGSPFALNKSEQVGEYIVGIDESSPLVNDQEGQELYQDGEATQYLRTRIESLKTYVSSFNQSIEFAQFLAENNLIQAQTISLNDQGKEHKLEGIYGINENVFAELSSETHLALREKGYLSAIYAMIISKHQLNRLVRNKSLIMGS